MTKIPAALLTIALLPGCATVMKGAHDEIGVTSTPRGAEISSQQGTKCTAPCTLRLRRNFPQKVTASMPGYQPAVLQLTPKLAADVATYTLGSILVGGVIGGSVDAISGAMFDLYPKTLEFHLKEDRPQERIGEISLGALPR